MELLFPFQRYGCVRCGKSCTSGWRVWLEAESRQRLEEHPVTAEVRRQGYEPIQMVGDMAALTPGGRCCYLARDGLCELHRQTGEATKPRTCQHFPFALVETPDGFQVGLTFRCTAVQQDAPGEPWEAHRATLERLVASGRYPRVGFDLDWQEYLRWERQWSDPWTALGERLGLSDVASLRTLLEHHWGRPRADLARFVRHLVERKFLLLGPAFLGRLSALALAESMLSEASWPAVEQLEETLLTADEALFRALEKEILEARKLFG